METYVRLPDEDIWRRTRAGIPGHRIREGIATSRRCMHNACMSTSITIRNVPDETRDELAERAALSGRSLQEFLRAELIQLAAKADVAKLLDRVEKRKQAANESLSAEAIIGFRDTARG